MGNESGRRNGNEFRFKKTVHFDFVGKFFEAITGNIAGNDLLPIDDFNEIYRIYRRGREKRGRGRIVFECSTAIYGDGDENRVISRINEHNEERGEPEEIGVVNEETRCRAVIRVNRPLRLPIVEGTSVTGL